MVRLFTPRVMALLAAGTMERACFAGMGVYLATYLRAAYDGSLQGLAGALALVAIGTLAGPGLAYSLANAVGRPPLLAALSEVSPEARGAILALNVASASIGWIGATALAGAALAVGSTLASRGASRPWPPPAPCRGPVHAAGPGPYYTQRAGGARPGGADA